MSEGYNALIEGTAWLDLDSRGRILARGRDRANMRLGEVDSAKVLARQGIASFGKSEIG